jgi:ribose 5-phosphate isomerase A
MNANETSADEMKRRAASKALELVTPGMRLGLGTGSTARHFVDLLGEKVREGFDVLCVPTSEATRIQAEGLGIPLTTLDETPELDMTVDGADELDEELRLVKGGGGALLREKIVAMASARVVIIADASKRVESLGAFPLPVEVARFGHIATRTWIETCADEAGCAGAITLRPGTDGKPFTTDGGNYIFDCDFGSIRDPELLHELIKLAPGVVETGLFIGIADTAFIAENGRVVTLTAAIPEDEE